MNHKTILIIIFVPLVILTSVCGIIAEHPEDKKIFRIVALILISLGTLLAVI